jgi:hypothetical protein
MACAQKKTTTTNDVVGGWVVCVDTLFSKTYPCEKPYTAFDFNADGTYTEYRQSANPEQPETIQSFTGKWKVDKQALGLKEDETPGKITIGVIYEIVWTDKDHFYTERSQGDLAQKMWMYFSRKK